MTDHVDTASAGAGMAGTGPVVLVRYRSAAVGETARAVHVVPLHTGRQTEALGALQGTGPADPLRAG